MNHSLLTFVACICGLLAICGLGYLVLTLWSIRQHVSAPVTMRPGFTPSITILKPLHGADPEMYESFRSHCLQDYPEYEIIFGVNDAEDPAVAEVERLRREFPARRIELVVGREVLGTNRKVSNLVQMLRASRYDHVLVNDSDIRVPPDYLRSVAAHFADSSVGLVTTLYRAVSDRTIASRLEAVTISTDFAGGVLCAKQLDGGMHFALGATLAMPRRVLGHIGGFEPLLDYLADDYELGVRTARAGYKVVLAEPVVETFLPAYTFRQMFEHQLRWARTVRDMRRLGYFGVLVTFALPWAILALLFSAGALWAWALLGITTVTRFACAYLLCTAVLRDERNLRDLSLVPLRDIVGLAVWIASFAGNTVTWRGEVYRLKDGKLAGASRTI
ncbi:MAG TPA: bacteriohopanetetrol glucosamine biosynthesis glycosyltransferase HpnI [Clostridia bacterium]|nr:bacteriohopanetetrol glucosamine biosynthesis glycosyltransferase HpnI [Clostridia bacterium]